MSDEDIEAISQDLRAYLQVFSDEIKEELEDIRFFCEHLQSMCIAFDDKELSAKDFYKQICKRQVLLALDATSVLGSVADKILAVVEFGELGLVDDKALDEVSKEVEPEAKRVQILSLVKDAGSKKSNGNN